jgi:hypothetical protein
LLVEPMNSFPFQPKSTAHLRPGQYWAIRLKDGRYACGQVLKLLARNGKLESRVFLAGLLDWCEAHEPRATDICGRKPVEQGAVHVKTITEAGGRILGEVPVADSAVTVIEMTDDIRRWGYNVINILAEKRYGGGERDRVGS